MFPFFSTIFRSQIEKQGERLQVPEGLKLMLYYHDQN